MASTSVPAPLRARKGGKPAQPVLRYLALGLLLAMAVLYQCRITYDLATGFMDSSRSAPNPFQLGTEPHGIVGVQKEAKDAGLREGDDVLAIEGTPIVGTNSVSQILKKDAPGDVVVVDAERAGKHFQARVRLKSGTTSGKIGSLALAIVLGLLLPWISILLGSYVCLVRPRDPLAWILLGMLLSFSHIVNTDLANWEDWIRIPAELYHSIVFASWFSFMFLFGYYFPRKPRFDARWPWIKWVVTVPFLAYGLIESVLGTGAEEDLNRFQPMNHQMHFLLPVFGIYQLILIGAGFTLLGFKIKSQESADARRRLRFLLTGLIASLTPILILILIAIGFKRSFEEFPKYVVFPSISALILFPLTLAYVIVVDRAMDVRVAIRQGLKYAFARSGLVVLRLLLFASATWVGYMVARRLGGNPVEIVLLALALLLLQLPLSMGISRLGKWIDKQFFREAYNAEAVLSELSDQVRTIRETAPLISKVCGQIADTLHLSRIAVLLERNGRYETFHASGFDVQPAVEFSADSAVVHYLEQAKAPPHVYFEDEGSWLYRTPGLDDEQRSMLAYLGAELLLPLSTRDKLLGFIAAGQKRSEEPYTKSDIRILSAVASQTGLALENAQLTTAIASEMAQRERLAREVEIAREVQERLFPQKMPVVEGLDYAGMCRTALGVGGDYYDYLSLPGGRFGLGLGDVSGKGISAALLMASLQASLRGEAGHSVDCLSELISNLNERVYEASGSNRYATFFYGQYTPWTRGLQYVNAGHNPPILMRRAGNDWAVSTLEATGTVVGLLPKSVYEMGTVQLQPGDYLILFTDGISEAMNAEEEEWGEERLTETVRACAESSLGAAETMRRIMSAADTFVNGAKQHDDMTVVVLRVI